MIALVLMVESKAKSSSRALASRRRIEEEIPTDGRVAAHILMWRLEDK